MQLMDKKWLMSKDCKERFGESFVNTQVDAKKGLQEIPGEIVYLGAAGQPAIVLISVESNFDLLERRASNYSDRSRAIMAQEILSNGLLFSLMNYGERRAPLWFLL